ncbi:MAG: FmdB family zinc ribbon protein [Thermodesulfobacteriota bacterium]|jgi:putative FmdB family regulatory protein
MPIYEYECVHCNEIFEIFHKIDEDCKVACPKCLSPAKKMISAPNFVLKGSGFYINDYPSESRREGKKKEKEGVKEPSKDGTDKGQGGKSEEKRAEKKAESK